MDKACLCYKRQFQKLFRWHTDDCRDGKGNGSFPGRKLLSSENKLSVFELDASADSVLKNDAFTPLMYCTRVMLTSSLQLTILTPRKVIRVTLDMLQISEVHTGKCSNLHDDS